ncbi:MAG TPA: hypothetical protein VGD59_00630 [Acidisarcina sp.]
MPTQSPVLKIAMVMWLAAAAVAFIAAQRAAGPEEFSDPRTVTIKGYSGDAMEPFLSRDGRYLFFNNLNDPSVNTDLYWAERIDDLTFQFKGEVGGVNTPALEGVASMDRAGAFYFISPRSYDRTASTIYRGRFEAGSVSGVGLVPGVSSGRPGIVNFDAEISADGETLYFVESQFDRHGHPRNAKILFARRSGDAFIRAGESDRVMQSINSRALNYAPATSASGLEIFFTRVDFMGPAIYSASRADTGSPFGPPRKIEAISGFVEAPTISPDGRSLYYHRKEGGHFVICRVTRE